MATVGVYDLKSKLAEWLKRAEGGETIVVTRHGKAVALLQPAPTIELDPEKFLAVAPRPDPPAARPAPQRPGLSLSELVKAQR